MAIASDKMCITTTFLLVQLMMWAPLLVSGAPNQLVDRLNTDKVALEVSPVVSHKAHVHKREHAAHKRSNLNKTPEAPASNMVNAVEQLDLVVTDDSSSSEESSEKTTVKSNVIMKTTTSRSRVVEEKVKVLPVSPQNPRITTSTQNIQIQPQPNSLSYTPQGKITPKTNARLPENHTFPIHQATQDSQPKNHNIITVINPFFAIVPPDNNIASTRTIFSILSSTSAKKTPSMTDAQQSHSQSMLKCPNISDFLQGSENFWSSLKKAAGWNNGLEVVKDSAFKSIEVLTQCFQNVRSGIKSYFQDKDKAPLDSGIITKPVTVEPTTSTPSTIHPILKDVILKQAGVNLDELNSLTTQRSAAIPRQSEEAALLMAGGIHESPLSLADLPRNLSLAHTVTAAGGSKSTSKYSETERSNFKQTETHISLDNDNPQDPDQVTGIKVSKVEYVSKVNSKYDDLVHDVETDLEHAKLKAS